MAPHEKATPKQKSPSGTDRKQSERFIDTARILNSDETGKVFKEAFDKLVPPKPSPAPKNDPKR
jgi:hypothetical protein